MKEQIFRLLFFFINEIELAVNARLASIRLKNPVFHLKGQHQLDSILLLADFSLIK
jgi:hypothetical protein